ncbi:MAG: FHA domain-containing protein [Spirochaetota bacterium]|nr:FHA domain-containing protein [Spirochaetota bacterium]
MNMNTWYLQGRFSDASPWIVPVYKNRFTIGRGSDRDLILAAAGVSRSHACLYIKERDLILEDCGSRNGTYLNGSRIAGRAPVRDGDILHVGGYEFTIRCGKKEPAADQTIVEARGEASSEFTRRFGLSKREDEVLYLLLRGRSMQEIGAKLFISPGTAKLHTQNIYRKTGCHSRAELITLYRGPFRSG